MASHFHSTLPLVDDADSTGAVSDALDTTGLMTLASGQGARVTTRENASDAAERAREAGELRHAARLTGENRPTYARHEQKKTKMSLPLLIGLIVGGVAVVAALMFVVSRCASSVAENPSALDLITSSSTLEATPGLSINYDGATYEFSDEGGTWQLIQTATDKDVLIEFDGTPVYLVICNETVYAPENLADGTWDIMACLLADGAVAVHVPGASGEGVVSSAKLDGDALALTMETGETVSVPIG